MYWEENRQAKPVTVPGDIVDMAFGIRCRSLPVDHAYALFQALRQVLPWLEHEPGAAVHPIHVADSGNGWMRPEDPDDRLYLSRRTRLVLRMPRHRIEAAGALRGQTLHIADQTMQVGEADIRPLSVLTTLFSRYLVTDDGDDEERFLAETAKQLAARGIRPRKMLPGKAHAIRVPGATLKTRSLMLAELSVEESLQLQQQGLGEHGHLGCGIFVPHKDIREVVADTA